MKKYYKIRLFLPAIIGLLIILTTGCKKDSENTNKVPNVQTLGVTDITLSSAVSGGEVSDDGTDTVIARGVCWSTSQNPTIADRKTSDGTGSGKFISNITGLTSNTTYYLRAYATNKSGTDYGREVYIKTYTGTMTDIDGNVYYTVTIGTQVWMAENLKTTKYRNSDPITNAIEDSVWWNPSSIAYCDYNNDTNNGNIYGHLYNWWVVNDARKVAPTGWHIPSDEEWSILFNYDGIDSLAGRKFMECDWEQKHWSSMALGGGSNETGFTALPGGYRNSLGGFTDLHWTGIWWSSTDISSDFALYVSLKSEEPLVIRNSRQKTGGASIRCVKD